jgi:glutathione S-transferase
MILVGQYDSPFVRRVAVTLHHYQMPFTRNTLSVFADASDMQKINPLVRIPSLILDSGETLIDSVAIVDALDEMVGPARALMPPNGPERRDILRATVLAQGATEKAGQVVYERHFHSGPSLNKEWEQRCQSQLVAGLDRLEGQCGAPWFFGDRMSHADVMTGCLIGYLHRRLPESFPGDRLPRLHALATRCEARDEFMKSRISPDETMPSRTERIS